MRIALLFPGQGEDLAAEDLPEGALALLESCGIEPPRRGRRVEGWMVQPALTALSLHVHSRLGAAPHAIAGHSLGEVAAYSAAGCFTPEQAIRIAAERGRHMTRAAQECPGGLLAVTDFDACANPIEPLPEGPVAVAAYNAPSEVVLSGSLDVLSAIRRSRRAAMLRVGGPWHGPWMATAVQGLRKVVEDSMPRAPVVALLSNRDGGRVVDRDDIADLLAGQLVRPVQWTRTMTALANSGITDYVTIGPGRVLRGLVRKNLGEGARVHSTSTPESLTRTRKELGR